MVKAVTMVTGCVSEERKSFDANEAGLDAYAKTLAQLHARADQCTADIQKQIKFYETCG